MHATIARSMIALICAVATSTSALCQSLQDRLFERVAKARICEQTGVNGLYCTYDIDPSLRLAIKDVGGSDTVIGFHRADQASEFYPVMYRGCVAVVPGMAHARNYDRQYGVHVSPTTGSVYATSDECVATLGSRGAKQVQTSKP